MHILFTQSTDTSGTVPKVTIDGCQFTKRSDALDTMLNDIEAICAEHESNIVVEEFPAENRAVLKFGNVTIEKRILDAAAIIEEIQKAVSTSEDHKLYRVYGQSKEFREVCPVIVLSGTVLVRLNNEMVRPISFYRRPVALELEQNGSIDTGDVYELQCDVSKPDGVGWETPFQMSQDIDKIPAALLAYSYLIYKA